jgi:hypothetical protein
VTPTVTKDRRGGPPVAADEGGGGSGWVLLVTAPNEFTAHLVRGRLEEDSIEVHLDSFNPSPVAWMKPFGDPLAPVKVYVRRRDFSRASLVLHDSEVDVPPRTPAVRSRLRVGMTVAMIAIAALLVVLEIVDFAPCVLRMFCI